MMYILLIIGFFLLVKGADYFVEGSSAIARLLKVPSVVIGLTIVAMGTSAPEAAVSITAGLADVYKRQVLEPRAAFNDAISSFDGMRGMSSHSDANVWKLFSSTAFNACPCSAFNEMCIRDSPLTAPKYG